MASETDERQVAQLIDGDIGWSELRNDVLPDPKDGERFEVTRRLLEERVDFEEPILLPLSDHLYAVGTDRGRIVKCDCGQEFCSLEENWKHHARVRVREAEADHREIYPEYQTPRLGRHLRILSCVRRRLPEPLLVEGVDVGLEALPERPTDCQFRQRGLAAGGRRAHHDVVVAVQDRRHRRPLHPVERLERERLGELGDGLLDAGRGDHAVSGDRPA